MKKGDHANMSDTISKTDVIDAIREFVEYNEGDESTIDVLLAVGARILDTDTEIVRELVGGAAT